MSRVLITVASLAGIALTLGDNAHERAYYLLRFHDWMIEHNLSPASGDEFVHMLDNFANNHDLIESHNAGDHSYTLGHNRFSHLSVEEFRAYVRLGLDRPSTVATSLHAVPDDLSSIPASVDWRQVGAVTAVKDQGQCGSCWSFSATGALEGAYQIKYKDLQSFSEQELVDCDRVDHGCNGGLMDNAFSFVQRNGGLCTEAAYPYTSGSTKKEGTCNEKSCTKNANVAPKGFTDVTPNSDSALLSALAQQPSVAIETDQAAVNKGGYIRLARGSSMPKEGQCGILVEPSYPNL